jgi:hypothetical protein
MNSDSAPDGPGRGSGRHLTSGGGMFRDEDEFLESLRNQVGEERLQRIEQSLQLAENPRPLNVGERQILTEAIAPLLRDLAATGIGPPDIRPEAHHDGELPGVRAWIREPSGRGGSGIEILTDLPPGEQVARLAEQIQEWAADQLHDAGLPPQWPQCPEHPSPERHALSPEVRDGNAIWVCPESGDLISAIGSLPQPHTS